MSKNPKPPKTYSDFVKRFPALGEAWQQTRSAEEQGPIDESARRLIKLGAAIGALREGAVHSAVRKARAAGVPDEAIYQVVALAASTIGLPASVAAYSWVREVLEK